MLDDGPRKVKREDYKIFAHNYPDSRCNTILEAFYPKETQYKIKGLKQKTVLNGKIGQTNGIYHNERVGIKI